MSKPRLGKGLDVLLPAAPAGVAREARRENFAVAVEDVHPSPTQPRTHFDEEALEELAQSIRSVGILEPILVRKRATGGYEIIAGERRWRAAQRAGLKEVPVFVRELNEQRAFEAALVENLQREDLNPIETARAFQRLVDEHGHTQDSIAALIGKDRSTIANALRLLKLPEEVLQHIESGRLTEGHGRAILQSGDVPTMLKLARMTIAKSLSVREVERRAREVSRGATASDGGKGAAPAGKSANVRDLEQRLSRALGLTVTVEDQKGRGHVAIHYADLDQLDDVVSRLLK